MYLRVIPQAESGAFSEGTAKAAAVLQRRPGTVLPEAEQKFATLI